jgi:hypothetical protein
LHALNFDVLKKLRHGTVRMKGLEPPRLTAPDPKSGAATNYATSALLFSSRAANIRILSVETLLQQYQLNSLTIEK